MPGLYAAFDRFPSPKGAGTHIAHAAAALLEHAGGGVLAALREEDEPEALPQDPGGTLARFYHPSPNLLVRADAFASWLWENLSGKWEAAFCQFRDPWGGVPIAEARAGKSPLIYEVNGLPSVEMPYHFPKLAASAVEKLRSLERYCLERCDGVIVPSAVIRDNLVKAGVPGKKVAVIPNGAAIPGPAPRPEGAPGRYLIYFGALQPWQGVPALLRAFAELRDYEDLHLVICSSSKPKQARALAKLAERLGVAEKVRWLFQLDRAELAAWVGHAAAAAAPLTESPRNLEQGCCPLKVLEAMAAGIPVVASDLPVTRELIEDGATGHLARAGRPGDLAMALRLVLEYPEQAAAMGKAAQEAVRQRFTWEQNRAATRDFFRRLTMSP